MASAAPHRAEAGGGPRPPLAAPDRDTVVVAVCSEECGVEIDRISPTPGAGAVAITVRYDETESSDVNSDAKGKVAVAAQHHKQKGLKKDECVVIDVRCGGDGVVGEGDAGAKEEKVCRICHLSSESGLPERSELIQIGCGCKGELGIAHRHCAVAWFRVKGNRCCEICGLDAQNIKGEDSRFMDEWYDRRMLGSGNHRNSSERVSCSRGQQFCNCLMACLVVAFILSWFFRVNTF